MNSMVFGRKYDPLIAYFTSLIYMVIFKVKQEKFWSPKCLELFFPAIYHTIIE